MLWGNWAGWPTYPNVINYTCYCLYIVSKNTSCRHLSAIMRLIVFFLNLFFLEGMKKAADERKNDNREAKI